MANELRCVFLTAMGLACLLSEAKAEPVKVTKIHSSQPVGQWAIEEASGRIFASVPSADRIVEYEPATGKEVRTIELPGGPVHLAIKGHWLVAACPKNSSLGLVDLKINKAAGSVQLAGKGPYCLFCSRTANDYAYGVCNTGTAWWDGEIFQVDCRQKTVRNRRKVQGMRQSNIVHAAMSVDGKWIVTDARPGTSPSGADLIAIDEEAFTFKDLLHHHSSFGQIAADPSGRWWTLGNILYPLDLSASVRTFAGSPLAIHPSRDLVVAVGSGGGLVFQSFSGGAESEVVKLDSDETAGGDAGGTRRATPRPQRPTERGAGTAGPSGDPRIAFDLAGDRVVYATGDIAYIVAAGDLIAKSPKRLAIAGVPRMDVIIDRKLTARLALADGGAASWKIESGPAFAKLIGPELSVAPTAADLGHHEIVVKATRDDAASDSITIPLDVGVPAVDLGFRIQQMALDPAGKTALAWGLKASARSGYEPNAANEPTQFALVDLDEVKSPGAQSVTAGIQVACLDEKYIYMALTSGNVLYRLDRGDKSKRIRLFLNGRPLRMEVLPGGQLAIKMASDHLSSIVVYDRETLTRNPGHFAQTDGPSHAIDESPAIAEQGMDGTLVFRDKIVDAASGEFRCALEVNALPALADASVQENYSPGRRTAGRALWARMLSGQMLANARGSRVADFRGIAALSAFDPLAACVRIEQGNRETKKLLEFHEVKLGEVLHSVDLGGSTAGDNSPEYYNGYPCPVVQFTKNHVVIRDGSRMIACPIPDNVRKKATAPLTLKVPKLAPVGVDKVVEVQFSVFGDEGTPTYALTKEYEGLSIDAAKGKVAVDLPLLWTKHLKGRARPGSPYLVAVPPPGQEPDPRAIFERLTGTPLEAGKVAFRLPLRVGVSNTAGESDELRLSMIVVAPKEDLDKVAVARQAELAAMQAKAQAEMQRRQQEQAKLAAERGIQTPGGSDADRIRELENRVRRMEITLDAVLLKLERMERSHSGSEKRETPSKQP